MTKGEHVVNQVDHLEKHGEEIGEEVSEQKNPQYYVVPPLNPISVQRRHPLFSIFYSLLFSFIRYLSYIYNKHNFRIIFYSRPLYMYPILSIYILLSILFHLSTNSILFIHRIHFYIYPLIESNVS